MTLSVLLLLLLLLLSIGGDAIIKEVEDDVDWGELSVDEEMVAVGLTVVLSLEKFFKHFVYSSYL